MGSRKLTVKEDEKGIFVRFRHRNFPDDLLVVRPGSITDPSFPHAGPYKKGEKVTVKILNIYMGFFELYQPNTMRGGSVWQGPRFNNKTHEWVHDE